MSLDKVVLRGKVKKNGKIVLEFQNIASKLLHHFKKKSLLITIEIEKLKRTAAQNRWLWLAYSIAAQERKRVTGEDYTQDELHAHNLKVIQGYKIESKVILGEDVLVVKGSRTSSMSTKEFNIMKEKLQKFYLEEYDIQIPDPTKQNLITDFTQIIKQFS